MKESFKIVTYPRQAKPDTSRALHLITQYPEIIVSLLP